MRQSTVHRGASAARWAITIDARRGRLVRFRTATGGRWIATEVASIANAWEQRTHGPPGHGGSAHGRGRPSYHLGSGTHDERELLRRFVRDAVEWMGTLVGRRGIERLDVFAPPRLLGILRRELARTSADRIVEHEADLAGIRIAALPSEPAISTLLG